MASYAVGDKVRMVRVTPSLYRDDPIDREVAAFFELCLGKVFRVEGFDEYGQLELWTTAKGNARKRYDRNNHVIWVEPDDVEPYSKNLCMKSPDGPLTPNNGGTGS